MDELYVIARAAVETVSARGHDDRRSASSRAPTAHTPTNSAVSGRQKGHDVTLAAEWGTGQVLWSFLWFFMFFIFIMLIFQIFGDIIRSDDLSGWGKAIWSIFIIFLPFLGIFVYVIARGGKMGERSMKAAQANEAAMQSYIRDTAGRRRRRRRSSPQLADLHTRRQDRRRRVRGGEGQSHLLNPERQRAAVVHRCLAPMHDLGATSAQPAVKVASTVSESSDSVSVSPSTAKIDASASIARYAASNSLIGCFTRHHRSGETLRDRDHVLVEGGSTAVVVAPARPGHVRAVEQQRCRHALRRRLAVQFRHRPGDAFDGSLAMAMSVVSLPESSSLPHAVNPTAVAATRPVMMSPRIFMVET